MGTRDNDWRALHGGLLLACLPLPLFFRQLATWPWFLLAPLLAYTAIVLLVPPLRRSVNWLHVGRLDRTVLAITAGIVFIVSATLLTFDWLVRPDLSLLRVHIPVATGVLLLVAGAGFSLLNAVMEEVMYRGILLDALASQIPTIVAVAAQAMVFGAAHYQGYPPGALGAVLAGIYGLVLGLLRNWTRGLAAPVIAHVLADATIYGIVVTRD
ncbi:hypothetical protein AYO44_02490 [Planctomycetaceae bacterium SCGC AG-212-F19]|nr:hypothetical protein AYO44_02490 [Planctomycetaceae bacterium SCGC AG-212-F19]